MALSPMMKQYMDVKSRYEDAILFFRLGDFYEMFYDDAKIVSKELELVLTGKQCGEEERAPMCGVPYHAADVYIGKLVERGYKVVICEQTEDPATAKGLVSRDVVRVVTPGTVTDTKQLPEGKNNYIASVFFTDSAVGLALADISTGEVRATRLPPSEGTLINELSVYAPREILLNQSPAAGSPLSDYLKEKLSATLNLLPAERFSPAEAEKLLKKTLSLSAEDLALPDAPETGNREKAGRERKPEKAGPAAETLPEEERGRGEADRQDVPPEGAIVGALGALVSYLVETQKTDLSYLKRPLLYKTGEFLEIDHNSRRNLEISETMRTAEKKGTLLWVLDKTKTAPGARLLRKWLEQPLRNPNAILLRQDAVAELYGDFLLCEKIGELLRPVLDLERIMTRILYGSAGGKELRALASTLAILPALKEALKDCSSKELAALGQLDPLSDLYDVITRTIVEDPPFSVREGGFIREGVNEELDRLRSLMNNSKGYLEEIERREKEATGIKNLKIGFNRVFGYYIEVSKSNLSEVPASYIRKQTLTGGERYITPELKELENTILGAADKSNALEYEIFRRVCALVSDNVRRLQSAADAIAKIDVYRSLAEAAVKNGYTRPEVDIGDVIDIREGRHPVVEAFCGEEGFVPNDALLDTAHNRLVILTGPNMAGKSTYMRQIALICIMAQAGSFVPAAEARIGVVDKLFTRVGASDDLASGQSTFMLEMSEVAYILKNATPRSLIIYDEIGRGTSTFDGMSIAKAVAEYTAGKKIGARTLFATHYHELCELGDRVEGVVNYSVIAKKKDRGVVFLRKIVRGAADDSYGIEVAQLAGVPAPVVRRAREVLSELEKKGAPQPPPRQAAAGETITFDDYLHREVIDRIKMTDLESLTPLEALNLLSELQKILS